MAEFFNTLTSLLYSMSNEPYYRESVNDYLPVGYGIHGIRRFKRQGGGAFEHTNLSYWALIGVGIFSGLYHTTLKYHTQMSDELSMHLGK